MARLVIGHRARWPHRGVHLKRPDISASQGVCGGNLGAGLLLLKQGSFLERLSTNGRLNIAHVDEIGYWLPLDFKRSGGLDGVLFALGGYGNEIADYNYPYVRGNVLHGRLVARDQALADEITAVPTDIRRAHYAGMPHTRHPYIMHVNGLPRNFGRNIDSGDGLADECRAGRRLEVHVGVEFKAHRRTLEQVPIACPARISRCNDSVIDRKRADINAPLPGRQLKQILTGLSGRLTQRYGRNLHGCTGNGRTLIRGSRRMPKNQFHAIESNLELFSHDLSQGSTNTGAKIDVTIEGQDSVIGKQSDENIVVRLQVVRGDARLARRWLGHLSRSPGDQ